MRGAGQGEGDGKRLETISFVKKRLNTYVYIEVVVVLQVYEQDVETHSTLNVER